MKIEFFTIVLNGMPYIKHHIEEFKKLSFPWRWHVVEGMADLRGDTAWGVRNGARIPEGFCKDGISVDGTAEYLNSIVGEDQIIIYRKGGLWDGKLEMVNAPLRNICEDCLLWEVDHDELWKADTIERVRQLFLDDPDKQSAFFYCYYFLGPKKYIVSQNVKSTRPYDWLRVWRFRYGLKWQAHEPPILIDESGRDIGKVNPFTRWHTQPKGLTFQHFAYTTLPSVEFKEIYYGYPGLTKRWEELQGWQGRVVIGEGFPGVDPGTILDDWDESTMGELLWKD